MGQMATVNLIAICLISGLVARLTKDHFARRKAGRNPRVVASSMPELESQIEGDLERDGLTSPRRAGARRVGLRPEPPQFRAQAPVWRA